MTGSRSKTILISCALFSIITLSFHSCRSQEKGNKNDRHGFLKSSAYNDSRIKSQNRDESMNRDRIFFTLIGEDGILDNANYDFYAVSIYREVNDSIFKIFLLKKDEGVSSATYKVAYSNVNTSSKTENGTQESFVVRTLTKTIDEQDIIQFKIKMDESKSHISNHLPKNYDDPFHLVIYFDGKQFYKFSTFQVDEAEMKKLKDLFQTSKLFPNH